MTQRYPNDEHMGQLLFLMGDSYRKKAASLLVKLASNSPADGAGNIAADLAEAAAAKKDRLNKAKNLFDRVVEVYRQTPPQTDQDRMYLKLGHFYRADCLFDLGQYEEAIKLYDAATLRYQDDPAALAAYVQIVNAYCARAGRKRPAPPTSGRNGCCAHAGRGIQRRRVFDAEGILGAVAQVDKRIGNLAQARIAGGDPGKVGDR